MSRFVMQHVPECVYLNVTFTCGHTATVLVDLNDPSEVFGADEICPSCDYELMQEQAELVREPADDDRDDLSLEARRELDAGTRLNEYLSSLLVSTEPMPF